MVFLAARCWRKCGSALRPRRTLALQGAAARTGGPSRRTFLFEHFGAMAPALGHPLPRRAARRIPGELGHLLAIGGVSQKFVGRVHAAFLLSAVSRMADRATTSRGRDRSRQFE